jgi:TPR repeat protein
MKVRSIIYLIACVAALCYTVAYADEFIDGREALRHGDYQKALHLWSPLADSGNAAAQNGIGVLLDLGLGVKQNLKGSVKWYLEAAQNGLPAAQVNLAEMYDHGRGVPVNKQEAMKWYHEAAKQGDKRGQCYLGLMYLSGEGTKKNDAEAAQWFARAGGYILGCKDILEQTIPEHDKLESIYPPGSIPRVKLDL